MTGIRDRFGLTGRRVLVTGAAGGIGRAVVAGALELGAEVVATDLDRAAIDPRATSAPLDLRDTGGIASFAAELGRVDAVVHVAGLLERVADIDEVTEESWDRQHEVNLRAAFFLVREVARSMAPGGAVVLFASQGWWTGGFGGSVAYNAAKGGLVTLSRGLARSLAPRGIRVNAVAPGAVDTPMMGPGLSDEARAAFLAQIPLGRMASPEEAADAALFLTMDAARYVTGAVLNVSGGQLMY
jgi:NAD(P)-dependent dehydrogenase (short-subunit alcohol dehydrogenase family)